MIYGGAALGDVSQEVADASVQESLGAGINHCTTAEAYGDSQLQLGPWIPRVRDRIYLATKTGDRAGVGAYDFDSARHASVYRQIVSTSG